MVYYQQSYSQEAPVGERSRGRRLLQFVVVREQEGPSVSLGLRCSTQEKGMGAISRLQLKVREGGDSLLEFVFGAFLDEFVCVLL